MKLKFATGLMDNKIIKSMRTINNWRFWNIKYFKEDKLKNIDTFWRHLFCILKPHTVCISIFLDFELKEKYHSIKIFEMTSLLTHITVWINNSNNAIHCEYCYRHTSLGSAQLSYVVVALHISMCGNCKTPQNVW